jgi:hypothetical protein
MIKNSETQINEAQYILNRYPEPIRSRLHKLRTLIMEIAEAQGLEPVGETLKWGEPSYAVKTGSPVRIAWKASTPEQYFVFFNCNTKLVKTFRQLYADVLQFQGNRAIVLSINTPLPEDTIRHCLTLALNYKNIKNLPFLGA